MPRTIRLYELAGELGMTNKETLDLSLALGIDVESGSSSIQAAQADRVRRRAERDGLTRDRRPGDRCRDEEGGSSIDGGTEDPHAEADAALPTTQDSPGEGTRIAASRVPRWR